MATPSAAEEQIRKHIRVERLAHLFRQLDEEFNGYERRVIHAYLLESTRCTRQYLAMGVLKALGIKSAAERHTENQQQ